MRPKQRDVQELDTQKLDPVEKDEPKRSLRITEITRVFKFAFRKFLVQYEQARKTTEIERTKDEGN